MTHKQEMVVRALFIISWFAGGINFAVRATKWRNLKDTYGADVHNVSFSTIASSAAATSVSICILHMLSGEGGRVRFY